MNFTEAELKRPHGFREETDIELRVWDAAALGWLVTDKKTGLSRMIYPDHERDMADPAYASLFALIRRKTMPPGKHLKLVGKLESFLYRS